MIKKEKALYKSGRKNPDGYKFNPFQVIEKRWVKFVVYILVPLSFFISILDFFNVVSWDSLYSSLGIINTIKKQDSSFAIYCLDVGQSDCTVIVCDDKVMMVDTGTFHQVYKIRTALHELNIDTIDYMVITHQHDDHMSGAAEIINHYNVSNIIMPKLSGINSVESDTYLNLIKVISKNNINAISVSAGDVFYLGSSCIEILSPAVQDKELNNMSIVFKLSYYDTKFLFQGDADKSIEQQILKSDFDISADLIKLGHHGSKTSSYAPYLDEVAPEYAVISCNWDNNYGHPSFPVVERLLERNITPYITSLDGNIIVTSDGTEINIFSLKN